MYFTLQSASLINELYKIMSISKLLTFIFFLFFSFQASLAQNKIITKKLDSIHLLVKRSTNTSEKIDGLLTLCRYYRKINTENLDSLSYYANKIISLTDSDKKFQNRKVDALDHLAFVAYYRRENDLAKKYIKDYKEISQKIGYGVGLSNASYLSAYLSLDDNDINMYVYQLENAYQIAKEYKTSDPLIFKMGIGLSSGYSVYNFNSDLISNVLLDLLDLVDSPAIPLEYKAIFYLDLGTLYDENKEYEKSRIYFEKSIQLFREDNNFIDLHAPLMNLAYYYQKKENHKKAVTLFNEALALNVPNSSAKIYYGLGVSYLYLKNYIKSEANFKKAQVQFKAANDYRGEADCFYYIATILYKKNAVEQANILFNRAIESYKKSVTTNKKNNLNKADITLAYSKIATIYKTKNNFKKSLEYHKLYGIYKDSLAIDQNLKKSERYDFFKTTTEKNNAIKNLEIENKTQEIHVAKEQSYGLGLLIFTILILLLLVIAINRNRLKQRAIKTIKEKNEENKLLMREIHHRVKNNLQIIMSLLGTQIDKSHNNNELKSILQESQNRIKSMAIIHQNLYKKDKFTKVSVNNYINELIHHIKSSFSKSNLNVHFNLDIDANQILIGLAVPLGLMLNELITNCYKYAFLGNTKVNNTISISFRALENTSEYALVVKDNGKGLPDHFDVDSLSSFGLQLVHGLTEQLDGNIQVTGQKGTCVSIKFKKAEYY